MEKGEIPPETSEHIVDLPDEPELAVVINIFTGQRIRRIYNLPQYFKDHEDIPPIE